MKAADLGPDQRAALADGASNAAQRGALLKAYEALEVARIRDAARARDVGGDRYSTPAETFIGAVLDLIKHRAKVGEGEYPPAPASDPGWRPKVLETGISKARARLARVTFELFRASLPKGLTTGQMTDEHVHRFLNDLRRERNHAPGTYNSNRNILASAFRALTSRAMRQLFKNPPEDWFRDAVEPLADPKKAIEVYTADDVRRFLEAAERRADPNRVVVVERQKRGCKLERYEQRPGPDPAPVLQWAMVLATMGLRRSEAQRLAWRDINLETGLVRIYGQKTKTYRHLPLVGDAAGDVSPGMLDVLQAWRRDRPDDELVFPETFPKHAWEATARDAGVNVTPQGLRRSWESVLAAAGIPASLTAWWAGHGIQLAERHYRAFPVGRLPGSTVDDALGLVPFLAREARGTGALRALPPAAEA